MPEVNQTQCKARRIGDQMCCQCGRSWDADDPDPPVCETPKPPVPLNGNGHLKQLRDMLSKGKE